MKPLPPWLIPLVVSQCITAAGVYGGIRSDLRESLVRVQLVEKRVDRLEDRRP